MDTAAWIALINTRDILSARAWKVMQELQKQSAPLLTTEFVLLEVADALSSLPLRATTVAYLNGIRGYSFPEIAPASPSIYADGCHLYCQRPDKEWSLTDCISFAVMSQRHITVAFTSDHHFEQAGFQKLL